MSVKHITSKQEYDQILKNGRVSAFDFWATWCGPCKVISPVFEKLSKEQGGIGFYKVDVDEQPDISQECGIRAMPTFIAFKNGQKVDNMMGANKEKLETLVQKAVALASE